MNKKIIVAGMLAINITTVFGNFVTVNADSVNDTQNQENKDNSGEKADTSVAHLPMVQGLSSAGTQQTLVQDANSYVSPAQQQAFLSKAVPMAQKASQKFNVYTSVMLAQSIIESHWGLSQLSTTANNLFGMKGTYQGSYVNLPTREWSNTAGYYYINANFRKYPTIYESFVDNGDKLRNGVSWDSSYYKGAWKENTSSYKDATAWLQGRYATESTYASILNNTIQTYNLTQYDDNSSA